MVCEGVSFGHDEPGDPREARVDAQKKTLGAPRTRRRGTRCLARAPKGCGPEALARAPKGERAFGKVPKNLDEQRDADLLDLFGRDGRLEEQRGGWGSADGETFLLYVEHLLCPRLKRGQLVVMDNLQPGTQDEKGEGADRGA